MSAEEVELIVWRDVKTGKPSWHMPIVRADGKPLGLDQLFEQAVWWRDATGFWHRIAEMEISHAANLVGWLERRAAMLHFKYGMALCGGPVPMGEMAQDAWSDVLEELAEQDPLAWLYETKLYQAVVARAREERP